jgi:hypothetical protein
VSDALSAADDGNTNVLNWTTDRRWPIGEESEELEELEAEDGGQF